MNADRLFDSLRQQVTGLVPGDMDIASIEFEASLIVVYVRNYEKFSGNQDIARKLATTLRRRVDIRPDPSTLEAEDAVEERIRGMVPEDADVTGIIFSPETGEVTIEAVNTVAVLGDAGSLLQNIRKETGWNVKVVRSPPIPSKTISDVRGYLRHYSDDRQKMLKKVAKNLVRNTIEGDDWVRVTALGGFRQVGRSAALLSTRNSKVIIDCGLDPGSDSTPYFSIPETLPISDIDAVVITHAHLDHCGTL
ncbi:MAG: MBL fold metallo-hydrolase, partial [Thermoplasmata archaeon]|nr:MBL fold metallo-hydrolase [Thermoplasmata archaeon]